MQHTYCNFLFYVEKLNSKIKTFLFLGEKEKKMCGDVNMSLSLEIKRQMRGTNSCVTFLFALF